MNDGGPAFPRNLISYHKMTYKESTQVAGYGMSLRDYFAALSTQGLLAHSCNTSTFDDSMPDNVAERAYKMADAMLAERNKPEECPICGSPPDSPYGICKSHLL